MLTDRAIEGCECYDAQEVEKTDGIFKLIYLKAGMSKLLFDYFIWIDADSVFVRNPRNVLDSLGKSPIHVPLTTNLSALLDRGGGHPACRKGRASSTVEMVCGLSDSGAHGNDPSERQNAGFRRQAGCLPTREVSEKGEAVSAPRLMAALNPRQYVELMSGAGVYNPVYFSQSSFWIVQREAIDRVVELATHFRTFAKQKGAAADVSACLGYAMQMLCANPENHRVKFRPDLWANDEARCFLGSSPEDVPWVMKDVLANEEYEVNPCVIHLPRSKVKNINEKQPMRGPEQAPPATEKEKADYAHTF